MLKRYTLKMTACALVFIGAITAFAANDNNSNSDQIQIQNATSQPTGMTAQQMNSPFADQIKQMMDMQKDMNQRIQNTMKDPFFSNGPIASPNLNSMDRNFSSYPQMKYYVKDNNYVVQFVVPGMNKKDIKIELNNDVLTVSGNSHKAEQNKDKNSQSSYSYTNQFTQSIRVPNDADTSKITSKYDNGILTISIPKNPEKSSKTQVIPIN